MRNKQPSSRQCFVCGVENEQGLRLAFYDTAPGRVEADWFLHEHFQGFPGIAHGGILTTVLDEAATRTVMGANGSDRFILTAQLEVRFRKPVPVNATYRVIGELKEDHGEIIRAQTRIEDELGTVMATASAVMVQVPGDLIGKIKINPDDWKVYPDGANA